MKGGQQKKGSRFVRLSENSPQDKFVEMGKLVQEGKAKRAYYAIEGNTGYYYYEIFEK